MSQHVGRFKFVKSRQYGGTAQRIGTPGVGGLAILEAAHDVAPANGGTDRHAVPQALAEHHEIRFDAIRFKRKHPPGASKIGLHFVEDQEDIMLPAEVLQQLQISRRGMEAAATPQVGFCNQAVQAAAILLPQAVEFLLIFSQIDRLAVLRDIINFRHWKTNELHPRIPVLVGLGTSHSPGESLFPVKTVPRGEDQIPLFIPMQAGPQCLLHGFGA